MAIDPKLELSACSAEYHDQCSTALGEEIAKVIGRVIETRKD